MTKEEFLDWKHSSVTQQVFAQLMERVSYATEVLIENAGRDPRADAWHAGAIAALRDMLNIEFEGEDSNGN